VLNFESEKEEDNKLDWDIQRENTLNEKLKLEE